MVKYNYVFFFSEGLPNDKGLALGDCKDKLIEAAKPHVDNISYYTPKILEDMGYGEYVKNPKISTPAFSLQYSTMNWNKILL